MADQKLSQLNPATTPLTGAELAYVVQGGSERRATAAAIADTLPDATTSTAGKMTAAQATLLVTALQPGQAIPSDVECRNNSGVGLTAGAPVYITGSSGTKPTVALADASSEVTAARSLGLVVATVGNNADCMVRTHGILTGINTSTLTEGAAIWLSETTGQLTSTRPTQPAHGVFFGFCIKQAAGTAGILYVNAINGQELDELHDVLITGAPPAAEAPRPALVRGPDGLWRDLLLTPGDVGAAPAAQGVTNGNSHNHDGGDGAQIAYSALAGLPTLFNPAVPGAIGETTPSTGRFTSVGLGGVAPRTGYAAVLGSNVLPRAQIVTVSGSTYTCDIRAASRFILAAAIVGNTTIAFSNVADLAVAGGFAEYVEVEVDFRYTSGVITISAAGFTTTWDGNTAATPTAGEIETLIIRITPAIAGTPFSIATVYVAPMAGRV
jgi:hypothetical protein